MRFAWIGIAVASTIVLVAACNQHATGGPGTGGGPSSGVGGSGGNGSGEFGGTTSGGTNDGGGLPCKPGLICASDEFCDFPLCGDGECGLCSEDGVCRKKPTSCAGLEKRLVCGCDDKVYDNDCEANRAGARAMTHSGGCSPPAGTFTCGETFCKLGSEICEEQSNGDGSISDGCVASPGSCAADDCDCVLAALGTSDRCSSCTTGNGGAILQCLGYGT